MLVKRVFLVLLQAFAKMTWSPVRWRMQTALSTGVPEIGRFAYAISPAQTLARYR